MSKGRVTQLTQGGFAHIRYAADNDVVLRCWTARVARILQDLMKESSEYFAQLFHIDGGETGVDHFDICLLWLNALNWLLDIGRIGEIGFIQK